MLKRTYNTAESVVAKYRLNDRTGQYPRRHIDSTQNMHEPYGSYIAAPPQSHKCLTSEIESATCTPKEFWFQDRAASVPAKADFSSIKKVYDASTQSMSKSA
jgi:hypothetical protein